MWWTSLTTCRVMVRSGLHLIPPPPPIADQSPPALMSPKGKKFYLSVLVNISVNFAVNKIHLHLSCSQRSPEEVDMDELMAAMVLSSLSCSPLLHSPTPSDPTNNSKKQQQTVTITTTYNSEKQQQTVTTVTANNYDYNKNKNKKQ